MVPGLDNAAKNLIEAAEKWSRSVMKRETLEAHDEELFSAVMKYQNLVRGKTAEYPKLPKPPKVPLIMPPLPGGELEEIPGYDDSRTSKRPTKPAQRPTIETLKTPVREQLDLHDLKSEEIDSIIEEIRPSQVIWLDKE